MAQFLLLWILALGIQSLQSLIILNGDLILRESRINDIWYPNSIFDASSQAQPIKLIHIDWGSWIEKFFAHTLAAIIDNSSLIKH